VAAAAATTAADATLYNTAAARVRVYNLRFRV
jgi:predicted porin